MTTKKSSIVQLSPEAARLFDYNPKEPPEDEMFDYMARSGDKPESVKDPKERAKYIKFLETFDADAE